MDRATRSLLISILKGRSRGLCERLNVSESGLSRFGYEKKFYPVSYKWSLLTIY